MELAGETEEMFDLQWACGKATLDKDLRAAGWRPASPWSFSGALLWLAPHTPITDLPVLPRLNQGKSAKVVLVRGSAEQPDAREVLRLWRSDFELKFGQGANVPIWYGALYREVRPPGRFLHSFVRQSAVPAASFVENLPAQVQIQSRGGYPSRPKMFLLQCPSSILKPHERHRRVKSGGWLISGSADSEVHPDHPKRR